MAKVAVNFTGVNDVPAGEMCLQVEKAEVKDSKSGHPMITLQCAIIAAEDDRFVGRKLFPNLLLETDMIRETFKALNAFGLQVPEGEMSFDTDELVGKTAWVFAVSSTRKDTGENQTQIKKWDIEPTTAKASIE